MSATVADPGAPPVVAAVRGADAVSRCPGCDAPLAGDERFCVGCGLRLAPDELRLAALPLLSASAALGPHALGAPAAGPAFRRPIVRSAAITAVVVLAFGIAIGATIGPAAVGQTSAAQRSVVLVSAPPAAPPAAPAASLDDDASAGDASGDVPDEVQTLADAGDTTDSGDEASAPASETPPAGETPAGEDPAGEDPGEPQEAPTAAPPPGSQSLAGVVVAGAADGEGFVLAARDGALLHVHASGCGVAPGDDLHLRARRLANGTWAADRVRRVGTADATRVAGTVVWTDPASGRYALGARGVTLLVTVPPPPAPPVVDGQTLPPAPAVPALGARLVTQLAPAPAHDGQPAALVERARRDAPPPADPAEPAPPLELAGVVQSVDAQARTLLLALDADAQPPLTVTLTVPAPLDLAALLPAQRVAVTAIPAPDGTLALSGVSPDGDALAADDASAAQGDQVPSAAPHEPASTAVATCTSLGPPARTAGGLKTFTTPPRDRNER